MDERRWGLGSAGRALAVLLGAVMLAWPALYNGLALLFPDSLAYLLTGPFLVLRMRGWQLIPMQWESQRSASLVLWFHLLHLGWLWPIVTVQALATAWVVWMVMRALLERWLVPAYLLCVAVLAFGTGASWYVSAVLADAYGALLYLGVFLLVFAYDTMRRWERVLLFCVGVLAVVAHSSHLLVGLGLLLVLAVLWVVKWSPVRVAGRGLIAVAALLAVAVAGQVEVHHKVFWQASLFGKPAPFLTARLIGDGTGRDYLLAHCPAEGWFACRYVDRLPYDSNEFLWAPGNIWLTTTQADREALRKEQTRFALAVLRAYPARQLRISFRNFAQEMFAIGPNSFRGKLKGASPAVMEQIEPGLAVRYAATKQAADALPEERFQNVQRVVLPVAIVIAAMLLVMWWRRRDAVLLGLGLVVAVSLVANAAVCGVLSVFDQRYQDRVNWMVVVLACVLIGKLAVRRTEADTRGLKPG